LAFHFLLAVYSTDSRQLYLLFLCAALRLTRSPWRIRQRPYYSLSLIGLSQLVKVRRDIANIGGHRVAGHLDRKGVVIALVVSSPDRDPDNFANFLKRQPRLTVQAKKHIFRIHFSTS
jgi:hypothetical protein